MELLSVVELGIIKEKIIHEIISIEEVEMLDNHVLFLGISDDLTFKNELKRYGITKYSYFFDILNLKNNFNVKKYKEMINNLNHHLIDLIEVIKTFYFKNGYRK